MCLWASYKKKLWKSFFLLPSLKKGVGSGVRGADPEDPDPHQNVTDAQHWNKGTRTWEGVVVIPTVLVIVVVSFHIRVMTPWPGEQQSRGVEEP